ncbi:hypothetical protein AB0L40_08390 [Patulibacter sp. NPDC049589]|uniref:hypothetical protein n=1 Tax=Patulibacter sp. NPDC049589 TaxID=3154731 RepID=UPI00344AB06E
MADRPGRPTSVPVRISERTWREEVERYALGSVLRRAAERERASLERRGIQRSVLRRCEAEGPDGTSLAGLVKAYVPLGDRPPSERPFGFVFVPGRSQDRLVLTFVAFGERHPRRGTRSVYQRAHKRLHGRYPDEG